MGYNEEIKELLESYHKKIESEIMPELAEDFIKFYSGLTELLGKLKNKGLLKDDPYAKSSQVIEIEVPDTEHFPESEAQWKVAERVTHFESVLSYITHNYNFSLNTFNFAELEKIKKFLDYYEWKGLLNQTTAEINTQSLGKIAISFRNSISDSLVIKTFDNCIEVIIKSNESILKKLKVILLYLKESYKQFIRIDILPIVQQKNPNLSESTILSEISNEIKENYSYLKFYKKYVTEVVKEEYSSEKDDLKSEVIKKLSITKKSESKKVVEEDNSEKKLIALLLEIGKIRIHLAASIDKLYVNHNMLNESKGSFLNKFFRKLSRALFNISQKTVYELVIQNKVSKKNLSLHFEKFYQDVKKLEFDLLNFTEEDKTIIYVSNSSNITKQIDSLLMSIKKNVSIFISLDEYLKKELIDLKLKAKGIKPELTVIKTLINSSTTLYRDYLDSIEK